MAGAAALAGSYAVSRARPAFDPDSDCYDKDEDLGEDTRPRCTECQMVGPLPTQSCHQAVDHYIGTDQPGACEHCGRLLHACNSRPCQRRRP